MAKDTTIPDPSVVLDLLQAFRGSKAMFAAVSVGVFDALDSGPKPLEVLALALNANPDALERLLDACVGLQLLSRDGRGYANTPAASAYLCKHSPRRLTGYISYSNDVMWKLWGPIAGSKPLAGTARSSRTSSALKRPNASSSWECTATA